MDKIKGHECTTNGRLTYYLDGGPEDGPLLIFVHGWPAIANTWEPQLTTFAALGFRVVAPDTRGCGKSFNSRERRDYSLERLVADLLGLLNHLEREEAVWIGHDWGSSIVSALAAHHPHVCAGIVNMCVPYRTLEFGLDGLVPYVNREIYPIDKYPHGPWSYQVFYEQAGHSSTTDVFDANVGNTIKVLWRPGDPAAYGKPSRTSTTAAQGGWFGPGNSAPEVPLSASILDEDMYGKLKESLERNGFWGPTSYYLNHDVNRPYSLKAENNGELKMPALFIEAKWDTVCDTALSRLAEPMRKYCHSLTETSIDAGHWVAAEKPQETNAALARWLTEKVPMYWPYYWKNKQVSSS